MRSTHRFRPTPPALSEINKIKGSFEGLLNDSTVAARCAWLIDPSKRLEGQMSALRLQPTARNEAEPTAIESPLWSRCPRSDLSVSLAVTVVTKGHTPRTAARTYQGSL